MNGECRLRHVVCSFHEAFEVFESIGRRSREGAKPAAFDLADRYGIQVIPTLSPPSFDDHEARVDEDLQVFHDREPGGRESTTELSGGAGFAPQDVENPPPTCVGEGFPGRLVVIFI